MTDIAPKLCYVDRDVAYFTTLPVREQWGDDWNDRPYDCNAGRPYRWYESSKEPNPKYQIFLAYWAAPLQQPNQLEWLCSINVNLSVQDINSGMVPWLQTTGGDARPKHFHIFAGTSFEEFSEIVRELGGTVGELQEVTE